MSKYAKEIQELREEMRSLRKDVDFLMTSSKFRPLTPRKAKVMKGPIPVDYVKEDKKDG